MDLKETYKLKKKKPWVLFYTNSLVKNATQYKLPVKQANKTLRYTWQFG